MIHSSKRRGALLYGVAGVIVLTGALVGIVLDRSLDGYRSSVQLEARLRANGAVEGAARVLSLTGDVAPSPIELTGTRVVFGAPTIDGTRMMLPATVEVSGVNGAVVYSNTHTIEFRAAGAGNWTPVGVAQ